jgi:flagellar hook-basal body complex protein FliE
MNSIHNTTTTAARASTALPPRGPHAASDAGSFKDFLIKSIEDVNSAQRQANQAVETLMTGGDADPAAVLTAVEKADLAFRMMLQMRNKVLQVYQEVRDIRI